ncbi:N-formylglutamate deformylase [Fimbriiglobus ruber]|uniref:N-formylglutamate deformylase n=2 Tax=Fimbriiglobus ruber TaxID=1908690 RepID=A0A225DIY2_9BACT|nr:N-formylglutamate deformylase [Fimbriiglobus ruber]
MARVRLALDGLSVGDAYGGQFFLPANNQFTADDEWHIPPGPWVTTDDTEMALGIAEVLNEYGTVRQDDLAQAFARRFRAEPYRGYGPGAFRLLSAVAGGGDWRLESKALFGGMGSFGNGSAMRVAPVGAYFVDDGFDVVVEQARLSAEVTHRHPEGIAGGIATAVATAYAWQNRATTSEPATRAGLFATVLAHTPPGEMRDAIEHASIVDLTLSTQSAASLLGNGRRVTCQDTVPFCLWVSAKYLNDYAAAIWETIRVGGDIDTNAAIVGGIVILATGPDGIPEDWRARREELGPDRFGERG